MTTIQDCAPTSCLALPEPIRAGHIEYLALRQTTNMDKREQIFEATLQLVLQEGFYHLNMKKVAKAAGVAVGTTYLYFASKEELILELHNHVRRQYLGAVLEAPAPEPDLLRTLQGMARNYLHFFLQRPAYFGFLQQFRASPFSFKEKETHALLMEPLQALVEQARAQGLVKNLPTGVLFALVLGPIYEAFALWQEGQVDLQLPDVQHQLLTACFDAVCPPVVAAGMRFA